MESVVVLTFPSTHQAMAAEDVLRGAGIRIQVIPAPPQRVRGCGLAVRLAGIDVARACSLLESKSVTYQRPGEAP
ncbi:MAG TPA: DUF3343 domain-containing protein [Thermoleophilia bacterium]|nr:DUF3343 domain-containing protein [Thermoleophilia bacterium]